MFEFSEIKKTLAVVFFIKKTKKNKFTYYLSKLFLNRIKTDTSGWVENTKAIEEYN